MQVLEDGVPIRSGEPIQGVDRGARVAGAGQRPRREQRRGQIGHRTAHGLRKILPGDRILLLLERPHADHQARNAVGAVELDQSVGEPAGFVDVAVGQNGQKGAAEQIGIARIGLEHIEVIGGGRAGIALDAGVPGSQVAAGGSRVHEILRRRRLGGER